MGGLARSRHSQTLRRLAHFALIIAVAGPAWAQSESRSAPDALALLERAAKRYFDLKSYKITRQETYSSEHPPDPSPSTTTAIEAPGGRYRFEGDIGLGNAVQISDGHFVWYYRPSQNAYTRRPANEKKPDLPDVLVADDIGIQGAAGLAPGMTWFAGPYKSATRLSDANLTLRGRAVRCYVIELTNDDLKVPLPYPFMETVWIEKDSFKIRKILEHYITTLNGAGPAPISYPATKASLYPEVILNEPIQDDTFQFVPPATARLVEEFRDRPHQIPETKPAGGKAPDAVLTSVDGSQVRLEGFRGHPLLIDLWAAWCGPCVDAFPELARIHERTRSTGLVILSVDQNDDAHVAQSYLDKMHYPWRNFHQQGEEIREGFWNGPIPRAIIIDSQGEIVFDKVSPTKEELLAAIGKLGPEYARALADR